jgi:hypothetical protein
MALIRVAQYSSTPTVVGDYQAQNAHLQAFTNQLLTQQFILDSGIAQPVIKQGCYVSHGGSLYVADADTPITGSPSDGSVYIRVSGTTSLTVEFVNDISGYSWNPVYTALTSGSYTLLPYLIVKASTVWNRYNFNPNNHNFGAIKATSVDTGQGATEVHLMNQNLRTTDSPSFYGLGVTAYLHGTYTKGEVFNFLSPYIPNTNDSIIIFGKFFTGTVIGTPSRIVRSDSTTITIYTMGANKLLYEEPISYDSTETVIVSFAL